MSGDKRLVVMGGRLQGKAAVAELLKELDGKVVQMEESHEGALVLDSHAAGFEEFLERLKKNERLALDMKRTKNAVTLKKVHPATGRNEPCPCGSGKKYKHCHMREQERQYVIVS